MSKHRSGCLYIATPAEEQVQIMYQLQTEPALVQTWSLLGLTLEPMSSAWQPRAPSRSSSR